MTRTDAVVQPRQSNTWGALSLDHVYEFMGGMNLAVRNVTGKDPDAYLSDYRNCNNVRMQEVKEAIGVESRTTILNPVYIKEKMKGDAGAASSITEIVQNTYGWNVMKPRHTRLLRRKESCRTGEHDRRDAGNRTQRLLESNTRTVESRSWTTY